MHRNLFYFLIWIVLFPAPFFTFASKFGSFQEAKKIHPDIFSLGVTTKKLSDKQLCYVICSSTEVFDFDPKGNPLENFTRDLYLISKRQLFESLVLTKDRANYKLELTGFVSLYQWREGNYFFANFLIPKSGVKLKKLSKPTASNNTSDVSIESIPIKQTKPQVDKLKITSNTYLPLGEIQVQFHKLYYAGLYKEAVDFYKNNASHVKNPPKKLSLNLSIAKYRIEIENQNQIHLNSAKLANLLQEHGDYISAIDVYKSLINSKKGSKEDRTSSYLKAIDCAEKAENYEVAIEFLENLRREYPFSNASRDLFIKLADYRRKLLLNR
jgi:hypothetical protein